MSGLTANIRTTLLPREGVHGWRIEYKSMKVKEARKLVKMNEGEQFTYLLDNIIVKVTNTEDNSVVDVEELEMEDFSDIMSCIFKGSPSGK